MRRRLEAEGVELVHLWPTGEFISISSALGFEGEGD